MLSINFYLIIPLLAPVSSSLKNGLTVPNFLQSRGIVSKEETFDKLEIRLGRVIRVEEEPTAPKKAYKMRVDFGKFGIKTSIGRFTQHAPEEILDKLVLGIVNFEPRQIGDTISEVLILGVQYPKADSGEATFITPAANAKIGGKLF